MGVQDCVAASRCLGVDSEPKLNALEPGCDEVADVCFTLLPALEAGCCSRPLGVDSGAARVC